MSWPVLQPIARVALLAGALMVGACTSLGPDYREPSIEWLGDWQPDLYGPGIGQGVASAVERQPPHAEWWRMFSDPVLEQLIAAAQRENPALRIAGLRILESRAILGIAGSALYPQAQQVGGAVSYVDTHQHGGIASDRSQGFNAYQAELGVAWELDFWGRFRRGVESADAAFFASIARQQDAQVLLVAQVAESYFAYRTTSLRIEIARENAARQRRSFEITQRIHASGQGSELDFQQARTQYLATLATIPELEATQTRARNALAALLGRPSGEVPELADAPRSLPDVDQAIIPDIPARLLLRRPDLRAAAWQVATQSAQIGIAEADYYPAITLLGSVGWSGNSLNPTPDTRLAAIGPSFTWNFFDPGRIRNNVRLQDARLQQSIETFQNVALQAAREIDDAAITLIKSREQRLILREAAQAAERSLELASTRYQEGYADFQRVLEAQRVLFSEAERELLSHSVHVNAIVALFKALGGGWSRTPIEQLIPADVRGAMGARTDWGELLTAPLPQIDDQPATVPGSAP